MGAGARPIGQGSIHVKIRFREESHEVAIQPGALFARKRRAAWNVRNFRHDSIIEILWREALQYRADGSRGQPKRV